MKKSRGYAFSSKTRTRCVTSCARNVRFSAFWHFALCPHVKTPKTPKTPKNGVFRDPFFSCFAKSRRSSRIKAFFCLGLTIMCTAQKTADLCLQHSYFFPKKNLGKLPNYILFKYTPPPPFPTPPHPTPPIPYFTPHPTPHTRTHAHTPTHAHKCSTPHTPIAKPRHRDLRRVTPMRKALYQCATIIKW